MVVGHQIRTHKDCWSNNCCTLYALCNVNVFTQEVPNLICLSREIGLLLLSCNFWDVACVHKSLVSRICCRHIFSSSILGGFTRWVFANRLAKRRLLSLCHLGILLFVISLAKCCHCAGKQINGRGCIKA